MQEVGWGGESQCIVCKGGQWELTSISCKSMENAPCGCLWKHRAARTCNHGPQTPARMDSFLFFFLSFPFLFLFWAVFLTVIIALPSESRNSSSNGENLRLKRRELQDLSGRCRLARVTPGEVRCTADHEAGHVGDKATRGSGSIPWMRSLTCGMDTEMR